VHPPPFLLTHRLSDWPDCRLELQCCKGAVRYPIKLMIRQRGDQTFAEVPRRLRCSACGGRPRRIWLCAGQREVGFGEGPDWAIELPVWAMGT
jgi:hypothetical protein